MKRTSLVFGAFAILSQAAFAADDPIAARKVLMSGNGAAAAVSAGMLKGEIDYNPVVAKAALASFATTGAAFGAFFPEGSFDLARSKAAERIWTDRAGFDAEIAEFDALSSQAVQTAGRAGPADLDAFKTLVTPILGGCQSCHETYQVSN